MKNKINKNIIQLILLGLCLIGIAYLVFLVQVNANQNNQAAYNKAIQDIASYQTSTGNITLNLNGQIGSYPLKDICNTIGVQK